MKRLLVLMGVMLVVVIVGGFLAITFLLGSIIKKGVETAGPIIAKVEVKLDSASLLPLSGGGRLKGLVVGNPEGFKAPSAIKVGSVAVEVVPRSIFSDKVVVRSIKVLSPEITFEGGLHGNNLSKLLDNIRGTPKPTGGAGKETSSASRRIQVDDFLISGGKINLSVGVLGTAAAVPLPDIHLANLGQGPEGITAAELSERLLNALLEGATKAVAGRLSSLPKGLGTATISTGAVQQVEKAVKGLGDLLKR